MKRTTDPVVDIVHSELGRASVPQSAFEKVWAHRGYRLLSEVQAEQAEAQREQAEAPSAENADQADGGPAPTAATNTARATRSTSVGETATGDSNQSPTA